MNLKPFSMSAMFCLSFAVNIDAFQLSFPDFEQIGYNYTGYTSVKDFGAKGDGLTNDFYAINTALSSGGNIYFPQGVYLYRRPPNLATTDPNYNGIVINQPSLTVKFNRSKLMLENGLGISIQASNVTFDLENGTIDGGAKYAYVSSSMQQSGYPFNNRQFELNVKDASPFAVGELLTCGFNFRANSDPNSNYTIFDQQAPVGRSDDSYLAKIVAIDGNAIVVEFPTDELPRVPQNFSGKVLNSLLPENLIVGEFDWSTMISQGLNANNFLIKSGNIRNVRGYFYHVNEDGASNRSATFDGIRFENSGRDQFFLKNSKFTFKDCYFGKILEIAKSAITVADNVSLTLSGCVFSRGNQDFDIRISSDELPYYRNVTISISNCWFSGYDYYMHAFDAQMRAEGYSIINGMNSQTPIAIFAAPQASQISSISITGSKFNRYQWSILTLLDFENSSASTVNIGSIAINNSTLDNLTLLHSSSSGNSNRLVTVGAFSIDGISLTRTNYEISENPVDLACPIFDYSMPTGFSCSNSTFHVCSNGKNLSLPLVSPSCNFQTLANCPTE